MLNFISLGTSRLLPFRALRSDFIRFCYFYPIFLRDFLALAVSLLENCLPLRNHSFSIGYLSSLP